MALKVPPGWPGVSHWWLWTYLLDDHTWATGVRHGSQRDNVQSLTQQNDDRHFNEESLPGLLDPWTWERFVAINCQLRRSKVPEDTRPQPRLARTGIERAFTRRSEVLYSRYGTWKFILQQWKAAGLTYLQTETNKHNNVTWRAEWLSVAMTRHRRISLAVTTLVQLIVNWDLQS